MNKAPHFGFTRILLVIGIIFVTEHPRLIAQESHRTIEVPAQLTAVSGGDYATMIQSFFMVPRSYAWKPAGSSSGPGKKRHFKFQQYYESVPVQDGMVIVHESPEKGATITGKFVSMAGTKQMPDIAANNETQLLEHLHNTGFRYSQITDAPYLSWIINEKTQIPEPALVTGYHPVGSLEKFTLYTDVATGTQIKHKNHTCHADSTGIAHTRYHSTQTILTSHANGMYALSASGPGKGVETKNLNHATGYSQVTEFTDMDNLWEQPQLLPGKNATDAHYCALQYYLFLQTTFNRNSLDNNGFKLTSYLNYGTGLRNAFWNGTAVVYGSGTTSQGPLTTLDIAGHEFTHGLIQKTANLNYSGEPGTINEAIADMFGAALEYYSNPSNFNWYMGECSGQAIRSLQDPGLFQQPDTYLGTNWYYGTGDNGGVHINSGFLNYWFYLLASGGTGVNDHGWNYQVTGIGMDKSIAIVYHTLTSYCTPSTGFSAFMNYTLQATIDLYGSCSAEYLNVIACWKAAGLMGADTMPPSLTPANDRILCAGDSLLLSVNGLPGSTYQWFRNNSPVQGGENGYLSVHTGGIYHAAENRCGIIIRSDTISVQQVSIPLVLASSHEVCEGEMVSLTGMPAGGSWSVPNPYQGTSTSYQYTFTDVNGCSATATGNIVVHSRVESQIINSRFEYPVNDEPVVLTGNLPGLFSGSAVQNNRFIPALAGEGGPHMVWFEAATGSGCTTPDSIRFYVLPPCKRSFGSVTIVAAPTGTAGIYKLGLTDAKPHFKTGWKIPPGVTVLQNDGDSVVVIMIHEKKVVIEATLTNTCLETASVYREISSSGDLNIRVVPNPSKGRVLYLREDMGLQTDVVVHISDASGKLVKSIYTHIPESSIHVEGLPAGVYTFNIFANERISTRKVVLE